MTTEQLRAHLASITSTRTEATAPALDPVIERLTADLGDRVSLVKAYVPAGSTFRVR